LDYNHLKSTYYPCLSIVVTRFLCSLVCLSVTRKSTISNWNFENRSNEDLKRIPGTAYLILLDEIYLVLCPLSIVVSSAIYERVLY